MPIKINPSPPLPPQKSTVKKVHMAVLNGWKNKKTNVWRLSHTSTYNRAIDTVCMVKTWKQYTAWSRHVW